MTSQQIDRRTMLALCGGATAAGALAVTSAFPATDKSNPLPRWRGVNLLEKFAAGRDGTRRNRPFLERDFDWLAEWGFDFVRLPMDYRFWVELPDRRAFREPVLEEIDQAVQWGRSRKIHVSVNFHRAPGWCVNQPEYEPFNLWTDEEAQEVCELHWRTFARRYKEIPAREISFNLWNEPADVGNHGLTRENHEKVVRRMVRAIREEDPDRLILADGIRWGQETMPELTDLGIGQCTRAYQPFQLTHYKANWARGSDQWPVPDWPHTKGGRRWDIDRLREYYRPWRELAGRGVGVLCGEGGVYRYTPHDVTLGFLRDVLTVLGEYNIGFALWNLRGSFGWIDSGRDDVEYEDFRGHKLDREMLEILRSA